MFKLQKRKSMVFLVMLAFVCLTTLGAMPSKAEAGVVVLGLSASETAVIGVGVAVTIYGAYKTYISDWGACGTKNHITSREVLNINTGKFETYVYPKCTDFEVSSIDLSKAKVVRLANSDIPISVTTEFYSKADMTKIVNDFSKGRKTESNPQSYVR